MATVQKAEVLRSIGRAISWQPSEFARPTHVEEQKLNITITIQATPSGEPYYPDTLGEVDKDDETDGNSQGLLNHRNRLTNETMEYYIELVRNNETLPKKRI
jgi:hypothetical protein